MDFCLPRRMHSAIALRSFLLADLHSAIVVPPEHLNVGQNSGTNDTSFAAPLFPGVSVVLFHPPNCPSVRLCLLQEL